MFVESDSITIDHLKLGFSECQIGGCTVSIEYDILHVTYLRRPIVAIITKASDLEKRVSNPPLRPFSYPVARLA